MFFFPRETLDFGVQRDQVPTPSVNRKRFADRFSRSQRCRRQSYTRIHGMMRKHFSAAGDIFFPDRRPFVGRSQKITWRDILSVNV